VPLAAEVKREREGAKMSGPLRGIHVNAWTTATDWTLRRARPALVKSLDWSPDWARAIREYDIRVFIIRKWADDDSSLVPSPAAAAERLWRRFAADFGRMQAALADTPATVYLETPWNEVHQETPDQLARLAEANVRFVELAHTAGWKALVGNFSVTWPLVDHFPAFVPALAVADGYSHHEYWMPGQLLPGEWTARAGLLYATLPADCPRPPVYVTECGIDNVAGTRPPNQYGWRSYPRPDAAYVVELDAFAASQPPSVAGLTVFNCGEVGTRWKSFELAESGPVADWLAAGPREWEDESGHEMPPAEEVPVSKTNPFGYIVGDGFVTKADELGWVVLSDELYHDPADRSDPARTAFSECFCDQGRLYYHAATGVVAVPFAS